MAAPSVTRPATVVNHSGITPVAPSFLGVSACTYAVDTITGPANSSLRYGGRYALAAPIDISNRQYLTFQLWLQDLVTSYIQSKANRGWSILLYDTSGNWSRYLLHFSGTPKNYPDQWDANTDGKFSGYGQIDSAWAVDYTIELSRTPEESSGTLNLAQLAGYEIHAGTISLPYTHPIRCYRMSAISQPIVLGGDVSDPVTFSYLENLFSAWWDASTAPYKHFKQGKTAARIFFGAVNKGTVLRYGLDFGNGSTATRLVDSNSSLSIIPTYDTNYDNYPAQQFATNALIRINQSATCYASLSTFSISGAKIDGGEFDFKVIGSTSGTFTASNGTIYAAGVVDIGHGSLSGVTFDSCVEVIYHSAATYTDCVIRGNTASGSKGLTISGAAGDYSAIDIQFADNTGGHDIEITPSGAGTFDLSGLSVKTGQSLKIHNTTATAITVKLASGITTTLSGGSITVEYPVVMANASISGLVAGSRVRIYNVTTATEMHNAVIAGTSYSSSYPNGTGYTTGDVIQVRIAWMSGASAKLPVEYLALATSGGWSVLASQQNDTVYNLNAIDGDTVTEFTPDYPNVQIDISDPDGITTVQRAYAWYISGQMTADGLRYYHGAITAEDAFNYRVNVSIANMRAQNVNTANVMIMGGRMFRSDGTALLVAGSGPIEMEYGRVYALETGVSGLTPSESSALLAIPTNPLLSTDSRLNNLDATVSSRLASASYTAPNNSNIAAIKAKTDNLPTSPAQTGEYTSSINAIDAAVNGLNNISLSDVQTAINAVPGAILSAAQSTPIHADTQKINGADVVGDGSEADQWRGAGV